MNIITKRILGVGGLLIFIGAFVFFFSSRTPEQLPQNNKINIVASFYPLSNIALVVGGNLVNVHNLVPSGVEPHDFEPSSRDYVDIGNSDILLYNGAGLEPWISKWEEGTSIRPRHIVNMANALKEQGVRLIETDGITDPHFWVDPIIMKQEVEIVRKALVSVAPEHEVFFSNNAERLESQLATLDEEIRAGLSDCSLKDIIVGHEAFDYFGREYGFNITSISGISPDEEPAPKDLARIISVAKDKDVRYVFFETVASPKFSELIAREIGGGTLALNPLESLTPKEVESGEDYVSVMEKNLVNLQKAMVCK